MLTFYGTASTLNMIFVFFIGLIIAAFILGMAFVTGYDPGFTLFGKFEKKEFIYTTVSFFAVFGTMLFIPPLVGGGNEGIIIGLIIGGALLHIVYLATENVFAPTGVHTAYNSMAVLLAAGVFGAVIPGSVIPLSASPIFVPHFQFTSDTVSDTVLQVLMQVVVATSEEFMKISLAVGLSMLTGFTNKWTTPGVAIGAWVVLHSILSYRV